MNIEFFLNPDDCPKIISTVPLSEIPKENGQANFGEVGSLYTKHGSGVAVLWNGSWSLFATFDELQAGNQIAERTDAPGADIFDKLYLGMPRSEVKELFGEPNFMGSGMDFWGYTNIGSVYFDNIPEEFASHYYDRRIATRITIKDRIWDIDELVSVAVKQHNDGQYYAPDGVYPTESHVNIGIDVNESGFTVYVVSLWETFLRLLYRFF